LDIFGNYIRAGMFLGGCATTINYSYDPAADFSTGKTYSWTSNRQDPLIEKNVRYFADQSSKIRDLSSPPVIRIL